MHGQSSQHDLCILLTARPAMQTLSDVGNDWLQCLYKKINNPSSICRDLDSVLIVIF